MISCIFAYAKGVETQSAIVELSDPHAALFLARNDEHVRVALDAWLAKTRSTESPERPSSWA